MESHLVLLRLKVVSMGYKILARLLVRSYDQIQLIL